MNANKKDRDQLIRQSANGNRLYRHTHKGQRMTVSIPGPSCKGCGGEGCALCNYTGDAIVESK